MGTSVDHARRAAGVSRIHDRRTRNGHAQHTLCNRLAGAELSAFPCPRKAQQHIEPDMTTGIILLNFGEPAEATLESVVPFLERIFFTNASLESAASPEAVHERSRQL